jgi:anti-sigma B factor antagonist
MTESLLDIDVHPDTTRVTLSLTGELDMASADALRSCLESIDEDFREVVLDLSELTFMDSSGLAVIIDAQRRCNETTQQLALHNPGRAVAKLLEITGMSGVVRIT